jgi:hypothetical protein
MDDDHAKRQAKKILLHRKIHAELQKWFNSSQQQAQFSSNSQLPQCAHSAPELRNLKTEKEPGEISD